MTFTLERKFKKPDYTIGQLSINGQPLCDTLEDTDRGLMSLEPIADIIRAKVYGKTAIPTGTYEIVINYSQRFRANMPLLLNVPGYDGVRIHSGNSALDTSGCILVGLNKSPGSLQDSRNIFDGLFLILMNNCTTRKIYLKIK